MRNARTTHNSQPQQRGRPEPAPRIPPQEESAAAFLSRKRQAQHRNNPKIKKNTRATLRFECMNIKGRRHEGRDKWLDIPGKMKRERIGVLAVCETHLTQSEVDEIENSTTGRRLKIFNCSDPDSPRSKGVAIVLHRDLTNVEGITVRRLVPGRAILATIPWHNQETVTVLAVYAPADSPEENAEFWRDLREMWLTEDIPVPDIELGDKNMTEEPSDRMPERSDPRGTTQAMCDFKTLLDVHDGWREVNPDKKEYTYRHPTGTLARLDRILVSPELKKRCRDWRIEDVGEISDHRTASVTISAPGAPFIGKGRYAIPLFVLEDKVFMKFAVEEGAKIEVKMDAGDDSNRAELQRDFERYKTSLRELAEERAKESQGALEQKKRKLKREREKLLNPEPEDAGEVGSTPEWSVEAQKETAKIVSKIQKEIDSIETRQLKRRQTKTKAAFFAESDTLTKRTMSQVKETAPRDTITLLKRTDIEPERVAKRSCDMAELARDYHNDIQNDASEEDMERKEQDIREVLDFAEDCTDLPGMERLGHAVTENEVIAAMKDSKKGKAAGLDGIPTELWQKLHR
ncbi:Endonuclease/exonuclease/phosphatase, partial [Mycena amicta]